MTTLTLDDEAQTNHFAQTLKEVVSFPCTIYFKGEIGAGKTCLIRYLLQALGVKGRIKSPTYAILESYDIGDLNILHTDLYRLSTLESLEETGFIDLAQTADLCLVEWPEKVPSLALPDLSIELDVIDGSSRKMQLHPGSARGEKLVVDLLCQYQKNQSSDKET